MRWSMAICFAVSLLIGAVALTQDAAQDEKTAQGTWVLVRGEADGKELGKEDLKGGKLVIKKDVYTVTLAKLGTITGKQKLDPTKKPKTIDITDASGPNKDKTSLGLYEFKDGDLRVVFAPPGKARPTKFATEPDSGQWLHVWAKTTE